MIEQIVGSHPIERIMDNAFVKLRKEADGDTVVGRPIMLANNVTAIPVSKVSMGFVSGGGQYSEPKEYEYPFAGASGAGMTITPICFLVYDGKAVKVVGVNSVSAFDKVVDTVPDILGKLFTRKKK